ncbi:MAG TPA: RNA methyltransferase [Candidatus Latescibacteria bacterium]|nr:RNA methyltransferase [Candidatus Latescibacterota bacterium]HJP31790.1 RNA methyltransferase [Candidatus Latescibacterota bacterium]
MGPSNTGDEHAAAKHADRVRIVLVEPASPGNIGSVARVLNNTGFHDWVLVNPGAWRTDETDWMAHGSSELLDGVRVVSTLDEAIADCHVVIGTSHRDGRFRVVEEDYRTVLTETGLTAVQGHRVAVIFGREKDGLSRDELLRCQRLIRIPSAVPHPSFNLSHAVLLVTYELFRRLGDSSPRRSQVSPLTTAAGMDRLVERVLDAMETVGFHPFNSDVTNFERVLRRFLSRTPLERRDAAVLHRICSQIRKFARRRD